MADTATVRITLPLFAPKVNIRKKSVSTKLQLKKRRTIHEVKSYTHPWAIRDDLSDAYDLPMSQREDWWRTEVKVTPVPGAYDETDFIEELNKRPNTYNFKAESRNKFRGHTRSGLYLVPGNYEYQDFIQILSKKPATYRFKDGERFASDVLNFGLKDKDIQVAPNAYSTQKYLAIDCEKLPVKNYMFRSQSKRFSYVFGQKDYPSATSYKVKYPNAITPAITSCFRSKTPRLHESGPGNQMSQTY